jgi:plasmid maintenance system antidote protein VapI
MGEKHRRFARGLFPAGDLIRDAVAARKLTLKEFAAMIGLAADGLNEVVTGKRGITSRVASALERELPELGKSAKDWMKLSPPRNGPRPQNIGGKHCELDDFRERIIEDYEKRGKRKFLTNIRRVIRIAKNAGITRVRQLNLKGYRRFEKAVNETYANKSSHSRNSALGDFRTICQRAAKMDLIPPIPFPPVPHSKDLPHASKTSDPSRDDMKRLLNYLYERSRTWEGQRLYSLVTLLLFTELQLGEALRLLVEDVDTEHHTIGMRRRKTPTWGREPGRIPLRPEVVAILLSWIPRAKGQWLFPGKKLAGPWHASNNKGFGPLEQLQRAGAAVGIPKLTFAKIHRFFNVHARPSYGNDLDSALRFPGQPCVEIRGKEAFIRGKPKGLFATEFELVTIKALINAHPDRLTWEELAKKSVASARRIVNGLRYKDADWRDAISLSGKGFPYSNGSVRIEPL